MNYLLKIVNKNKKVLKYQSRSKRVFMKKLRTIKWQDGPLKVHLRVCYGKRKDNFGKQTYFDNEGVYGDSKSFWMAFWAFTEKE